MNFGWTMAAVDFVAAITQPDHDMRTATRDAVPTDRHDITPPRPARH
jgi:hypothetical protein